MNNLKSHFGAVAPFEHYMWADSRADYPMIFWLKLTLEGEVEPKRLQSALNAAAQRHPLLMSCLQGKVHHRRSSLRWVPLTDPRIYLNIVRENQAFRFPENSQLGIDIQREPGVRLFIREDKEGLSTWHFQFHHSATDGTGAIQFVEEVFRLYADPEAQHSDHPVATELYAQRLHCGQTAKSLLRALPANLAAAFRYFCTNPAALSPELSTGLKAKTLVHGPAQERAELSTAQWERLKAKAKKDGATINDKLLTHCFQALHRWHQQRGGPRPIRVAVPVNMRPPLDRSMPAANCMGMAFIDRKGPILDDRKKLQKSLVEEMGRIKRLHLAYGLNFVISLAGHVRGLVNAIVLPRYTWKCSATLVLSNLGDALRYSTLKRNAEGLIQAGKLTLLRVELLPPLRAHTQMSMGVVTYGGQLTLTAHYDHTILSQAEVQAFIKHLTQAVKVSTVATEDIRDQALIPEKAADVAPFA